MQDGRFEHGFPGQPDSVRANNRPRTTAQAVVTAVAAVTKQTRPQIRGGKRVFLGIGWQQGQRIFRDAGTAGHRAVVDDASFGFDDVGRDHPGQDEAIPVRRQEGRQETFVIPANRPAFTGLAVSMNDQTVDAAVIPRHRVPGKHQAVSVGRDGRPVGVLAGRGEPNRFDWAAAGRDGAITDRQTRFLFRHGREGDHPLSEIPTDGRGHQERRTGQQAAARTRTAVRKNRVHQAPALIGIRLDPDQGDPLLGRCNRRLADSRPGGRNVDAFGLACPRICPEDGDAARFTLFIGGAGDHLIVRSPGAAEHALKKLDARLRMGYNRSLLGSW